MSKTAALDGLAALATLRRQVPRRQRPTCALLGKGRGRAEVRRLVRRVEESRLRHGVCRFVGTPPSSVEGSPLLDKRGKGGQRTKGDKKRTTTQQNGSQRKEIRPAHPHLRSISPPMAIHFTVARRLGVASCSSRRCDAGPAARGPPSLLLVSFPFQEPTSLDVAWKIDYLGSKTNGSSVPET